MKEVLKMQGLIAHATVRPPQLGVDASERAELKRLAALAGLLPSTAPSAITAGTTAQANSGAVAARPAPATR
jgi:hypothetical protein